jgi:hypothetical protein
MKKLVITIALAAMTAVSYGQGTVAFSNGATSPVRLVNAAGTTNTAAIGTALTYGLFYGTSAGNLALSPLLGAPSTTTAGIIWVNGAASSSYALAGTAGGDQPVIQFRGWSSSFGSDWQAARAAFQAGTPGVLYGETLVLQSEALTVAPTAGTPIWQSASGTNPNRFTPLVVFTAVPEPSTIALGILGAGSLLFLRRKR